MSDLDSIQALSTPPENLARSTTNQSHLGSAQMLLCKGYGSVPQSPALSRSLAAAHDSIGDLMNMKKFGGSTLSVRSETLVAKAVPLSTVTPRAVSPQRDSPSPEEVLTEERVAENPAAMTTAQRTQRLSRLLRDQPPQQEVVRVRRKV